MDHDELLRELSALDFWAVDLALYLDTHPFDESVIAKYNEIITEANKVRTVYEKQYGPLCSFRSFSSPDEWSWTKEDSWPWCYDFNFKACVREV